RAAAMRGSLPEQDGEHVDATAIERNDADGHHRVKRARYPPDLRSGEQRGAEPAGDPARDPIAMRAARLSLVHREHRRVVRAGRVAIADDEQSGACGDSDDTCDREAGSQPIAIPSWPLA